MPEQGKTAQLFEMEPTERERKLSLGNIPATASSSHARRAVEDKPQVTAAFTLRKTDPKFVATGGRPPVDPGKAVSTPVAAMCKSEQALAGSGLRAPTHASSNEPGAAKSLEEAQE